MNGNAPSIEAMHREFCEFRQEFREGQTRQIDILENIARQTVRMDHFRADVDKLETKLDGSLNIVFERLRDIEISPGVRAIQNNDKRKENIFLVKVGGIATAGASTVTLVLGWVLEQLSRGS